MFSRLFQWFSLWIRDISRLGQTRAVQLEVRSTRFDDYTRTAKLEQQLQAPLYDISFAIVIQ